MRRAVRGPLASNPYFDEFAGVYKEWVRRPETAQWGKLEGIRVEANLDAQALPVGLQERPHDGHDEPELTVSRRPDRVSVAFIIVVQLAWMIVLGCALGYGLYRIAQQLPIFNA